MDLVTAWVKSPTPIGGLDHLGVQAPSINIYGHLLPGITNVTDRARYYSFYPWLIWALAQNGHTRYNDEFINAFRKADSLFTLIAHQHANVSGNSQDSHAVSTVGSNNLSKAITAIKNGQDVALDDYAHRDPNRRKYFKNKLGGLGQYYLGVLSELLILDGNASKGIYYTRQLGLSLVKAMDSGVPRKLFMQTIDEGIVSASRLDELKAFCPCQLTASPEEHQWLTQLFLAQEEFEDADAIKRRDTLSMLIQLSDTLADNNLPLDLQNFRGCVYSAAMPNGTPWKMHSDLEKIRRSWAVYQRNELLGISIQGLFFTLLGAYKDMGEPFESGEAIANWYVNESGQLDGVIDFDGTWGELIATSKEQLPPFEYWEDKRHEIFLSEQIISLCAADRSPQNRAQIVKAALNILIALAARPENEQGYQLIEFPNNFLYSYPINLSSFLNETKTHWSGMKIKELLVWLFTHWGVNTHLKIALRKLRGQSKSTFRIRPSEHGMEVVKIPSAVHTSPRFTQAVRILKDLGLLVTNGEITKSTPLAQTHMDKYYGF